MISSSTWLNSRRANSLAWAGTKQPLGHVAVVAKDLKPIREAMADQPVCEIGARALSTVLVAAAIDVIDAEEVGPVFSTAAADAAMMTRSLRCDHAGCRGWASQFLQTWIDTLICRCWMHRIPSTDMRRDIREISREEAEVLYTQGS